MKVNRICIIISIVLLINLFCSCSYIKRRPTDYPNYETGGLSHGVVFPDPENTDFTFIYEGEPIELTYMLENGKMPNTWGFYIYLEGIIQPFVVDNNPEIQNKFKINLDSNEYKEIKVTFNPIVGKAGECLQVVFVVMLNPDYILKEEGENAIKQYGNNHVITQMPWKVKIKKSVENAVADKRILSIGKQRNIPSDFRKRYLVEDIDEQQSSILDKTVVFEMYSSKPEESCINLSSSSLNLIINSSGGYPQCEEKITYRLSLYADHQLINCFSGVEYADIEVSKNALTSLSILVNRDILKGKHHIYLIAVPISESGNYDIMLPIQKTESKAIKFI